MFEIKPKKFKKILVGVDDAPDARAAFSYAVDKAKRDGSELGIVSILETGNINVYQILDKDYVHSTEDELRKRVNEYVQAAIDYGVDPKKITGIVDRGERPAERICNHVIPAFQPEGRWFPGFLHDPSFRDIRFRNPNDCGSNIRIKIRNSV